MPIERSHGKARPGLPRASDLPTIEAAPNPRQGRTEGGHFAAGNRVGLEARVKHSMRKALGSKADAGEAGLVARDAQRIFGAYMRCMAVDSAPVRAMCALAARHAALAAFYGAAAVTAGLTTDKGLALQTAADRQSQRAERVLVTAHDLAARRPPRKAIDPIEAARSLPPLPEETDDDGR